MRSMNLLGAAGNEHRVLPAQLYPRAAVSNSLMRQSPHPTDTQTI
jgi:hypothetical protein